MAYRRGRYVYRSWREGDRVVTEYVGVGAEDAIREDAARRQALEVERATLGELEVEQKAIDGALDAAGDAMRELTAALMAVNGYHRHKGQWRKRRHGG